MSVKIETAYDRWRVRYTLTGPEQEVEAKVVELLEEWPTPGYGTAVTHRGWDGTDRVVVVSRSRSCD